MNKIGNGSIPLPLNKRQYFVLVGGMSRKRPLNMPFVKLAAELNLPCDIDIPVQDYHTPDPKLLYRELPKVIDLILAGEPVYVGCMGGIGRTGLLLAIVAKAFGVKNPVKYVRKHFIPHAVETEDQQEFVKKFKVDPRIFIKIAKARKARPLTFQPRLHLFGWTLTGPELPRFWDKAARATNLTRDPDPNMPVKLEVPDDPRTKAYAGILEQEATNERGHRIPKRDMRALGPDLDDA